MGIKSEIRKVIKSYFGCQRKISVDLPIDPFVVQRELINVKESIIIDIGSHIGGVAKIYRKQFPFASIYCFEPFPLSFQTLLKNVGEDPRIFCYPKAVSANEGTAVLNVNISSPTNSLLMTDKRGASFWGDGLLDTTSQIEVNTTTVDNFCLREKISRIDILKMDVQGNEYSVLLGAKEMLANQRISLIYTELIMCPTYEGQHKLHEYLMLLDSLGYDLLDYYSPHRVNNQLIQADFIFLSSSFKNKVENSIKNA